MPVRDLVLSPDASFLLVQSSDGVVLCDATGVVWYVNPAAGQLLRVTSNDMKGRSIVPLFAPEWRGDVAQMLLNPAEAAAELSVDILSQGGQRLEISLRCEVWPPDDSLRALFLRPGAEVTLSNWMASSPDAVYRELLDGLPSAVLEFDPTGIILYSNRQIEALLGYRPEEMIGRGALEFVAQEARARLRLALAEQQTNPRLVQHEYPLLAKDGSIKYATTHSSPVLRGGRLVCIRTVLNDVTEHRRRESVLRVSEARLTHVFQHLPVMMCALDDQRLVTVWNAECERVTGYRAQEILGNPEFAALLAGSSQNLMLALAGPEAPGKELRDFEIELRHNSGQPRTVLWSNVSRRVPIEGWSSWCTTPSRPRCSACPRRRSSARASPSSTLRCRRTSRRFTFRRISRC
ncbi:MAG: PAS domain S-box protein [Myxococcota bacterium]|nr:PAS domain S-box protein [Myxococcota bacterium]